MVQLNVDCLVLIFNELQDRNSLHSCLLINREWCYLVVPLLWRKYLWSTTNESIFFNIILSFLPPSSKQLLSDNNIKLPPTTIFLKPPLFNYISFCEFPISYDVKKIIKMALDISNDIDDKKIILEQEIYKLFISQCKNIKELQWYTSQPLSLFPGASTCFSQLYSLSIDLNCINPSALYEMAQICKDLNELEIFYCSKDLPEFVSLIDAQRNLSTVKINYSKDEYGRRYYGGRHDEELSKVLARKGIIKTIINSCPNIKFLSISLISNNDLIHIKSLLLNCKRLMKITLKFLSINSEESGDELLDILAKFSPKSLTCISIGGYLKYSVDTFEQFFQSYKEKSLCYCYITLCNPTESHKSVVKKYIDERMIRFSNQKVLSNDYGPNRVKSRARIEVKGSA